MQRHRRVQRDTSGTYFGDKIENGGSCYIEKLGRSYYYIADETIVVGDEVIVPFGKTNTEMHGEVKSIEVHLSNEAPYPAEKTKHILRKLFNL